MSTREDPFDAGGMVREVARVDAALKAARVDAIASSIAAAAASLAKSCGAMANNALLKSAGRGEWASLQKQALEIQAAMRAIFTKRMH